MSFESLQPPTANEPAARFEDGTVGSKPNRVGYWREDGVRIEVVEPEVAEQAAEIVKEAIPDVLGVAGLMKIIRRHSRLGR
jgi:hypothetical protein